MQAPTSPAQPTHTLHTQPCPTAGPTPQPQPPSPTYPPTHRLQRLSPVVPGGVDLGVQLQQLASQPQRLRIVAPGSAAVQHFFGKLTKQSSLQVGRQTFGL